MKKGQTLGVISFPPNRGRINQRLVAIAGTQITANLIKTYLTSWKANCDLLQGPGSEKSVRIRYPNHNLEIGILSLTQLTLKPSHRAMSAQCCNLLLLEAENPVRAFEAAARAHSVV